MTTHGRDTRPKFDLQQCQDDFQSLGFRLIRAKKGQTPREIKKLWDLCVNFVDELDSETLLNLRARSENTVDHLLLRFLHLHGATSFGKRSSISDKLPSLKIYSEAESRESILEKFRSLGNVLQYLAGLDTKGGQQDDIAESIEVQTLTSPRPTHRCSSRPTGLEISVHRFAENDTEPEHQQTQYQVTRPSSLLCSESDQSSSAEPLFLKKKMVSCQEGLVQLLDALSMPKAYRKMVQNQFRFKLVASTSPCKRSMQYENIGYPLDSRLCAEWNWADMHSDLGIPKTSRLWAAFLFVAFALRLKICSTETLDPANAEDKEVLENLATQMDNIVHHAAIFRQHNCDQEYRRRAWLEVIQDIEGELCDIHRHVKDEDADHRSRRSKSPKPKSSVIWKEIKAAVHKRCGPTSAKQSSDQHGPYESNQQPDKSQGPNSLARQPQAHTGFFALGNHAQEDSLQEPHQRPDDTVQLQRNYFSYDNDLTRDATVLRSKKQAALKTLAGERGQSYISPASSWSSLQKRSRFTTDQQEGVTHESLAPFRKKPKKTSSAPNGDADLPLDHNDGDLEDLCRAPVANMTCTFSARQSSDRDSISSCAADSGSVTGILQEANVNLNLHPRSTTCPPEDTAHFFSKDWKSSNTDHIRTGSHSRAIHKRSAIDPPSKMPTPAKEQKNFSRHKEQSLMTVLTVNDSQPPPFDDLVHDENNGGSGLDRDPVVSSSIEKSLDQPQQFLFLNQQEDIDITALVYDTYPVYAFKDEVSMKTWGNSYMSIYRGPISEPMIREIFQSLEKNESHRQAPSIRIGIHPDCGTLHERVSEKEILPDDIISTVNEFLKQVEDEKVTTPIHYVISVGEPQSRFLH